MYTAITQYFSIPWKIDGEQMLNQREQISRRWEAAVFYFIAARPEVGVYRTGRAAEDCGGQGSKCAGAGRDVPGHQGPDVSGGLIGGCGGSGQVYV